MKKIITLGLLLVSSVAQANVERYVAETQKVNQTYSTEMREFYRELNPFLTEFSPQEKNQFCKINQRYVDDMYRAIDKNRAALGAKVVTRQDVIQQQNAKMSVLAQKYNLTCDLK